MGMHVSKRLEEGIRSPWGWRYKGASETPSMAAGSRAWVLWKSGEYSYRLSHFASPKSNNFLFKKSK